jgi:ubiquitin carboxyl-terminal hydrolase 4/11/15
MSFDHHPSQKRDKKEKLKPSEHIYGCLEFFRQDEKLGKDNSWYCNICKGHVQATKKIEIYTVPPIIIFCL